MTERSILLVDHVLLSVPYRPVTFTFPGSLAVRLGYDRTRLAKVLLSLGTRIDQSLRHRVKRQSLQLRSVSRLHPGSLAVTQRFRFDLGLDVHGHSLSIDGALLWEMLAGFAALVPPPHANTLRYRGVLSTKNHHLHLYVIERAAYAHNNPGPLALFRRKKVNSTSSPTSPSCRELCQFGWPSISPKLKLKRSRNNPVIALFAAVQRTRTGERAQKRLRDLRDSVSVASSCLST